MALSAIAKLDQDHYRRVIEARPEIGTLHARPDGDGAWARGIAPSRGSLIAALEAWADARGSVETNEFSPRDLTGLQMDQTVLEGTLELVRSEAERQAQGETDPDVLSGPLWTLLRQAHQVVPTTESVEGLRDRLQALGAHLETTRAEVKQVDSLLLERARLVGPWAEHVLADVVKVALRKLPNKTPEISAELEGARAAATEALAPHRAWLAELSADDVTARLGEDAVTRLFEQRRLEMSIDDALDVARIAIEEARIEMRRLRRRAFKKRSLEEAFATARQQTPLSAEEAAYWLSELAEQSRAFCLESGMFPMTAQDSLVIEEGGPGITPTFGEVVLGPAGTDVPGVLILGDVGEDTDRLLRLSVVDLESVCARWGFPGAHLFHALSARDSSLNRSLPFVGSFDPVASLFGQDLVDGWALHSEELMREVQFRESPAARLVVCDRQLRAGLLAWYDVMLATGRQSAEEVVEGLTTHGAFRPDEARRAVLDMHRRPSAAIGAIAGKARLMQLRRAARVQWRHGYSERRFNELVLSAGSLPVAVLFGLLEVFSPFNADEGTVEYELGERPDDEELDEGTGDDDTVDESGGRAAAAAETPDAGIEPAGTLSETEQTLSDEAEQPAD